MPGRRDNALYQLLIDLNSPFRHMDSLSARRYEAGGTIPKRSRAFTATGGIS
jgi:hypothetical protein